MNPGRSVRIHRWADAPNQLRRTVHPAQVGDWDWLAWVPAHLREGAGSGFGWAIEQRVEGPEGSLIVVGKETPVP